MPEAPSFQNAAIAERYLMSVSPEAVFNWFAATAEKTKDEDRLLGNSPFDEKATLQLLTRGEPLVDLAIAKYCDNADVLSSLWNSGDRTTRLAIAYNTFRLGFAGLPTADFNDTCADAELVSAIFMNSSMTHGGLANYLEREGDFKSLSEDSWLTGLRYAMFNPILRKSPREDRFSDDGWEHYEQSRPFSAAWKLLLTLDNNDRNAAVLSDAFMNIAAFWPPRPMNEKEAANPLSNLAEFSERSGRDEIIYVQHVLQKWRDPRPLDKDDEKWGNSRTLIRQGIAAAAAKRSYDKELIALIREHPDKWVRAGYYRAFPFRDEACVRAAFKADESFFTEHAVYNNALYLTTPAGRVFRSMVSHKSGPEWQDFSNDQMRRAVHHNWALRLWRENPHPYPHPDDELDALHPPPLKREKDESVSEFLWRHSEMLKAKNDARLSQVLTWLHEAPEEPHRIYPLIVRMMHALHGDVQECLRMLAEDQQTGKARSGLSLFGGERRR